jgi:hypothetical protein
VTEADKRIQERLRGFQRGGDAPQVSHFLAPETDRFERPEPQAKTEEYDP